MRYKFGILGAGVMSGAIFQNSDLSGSAIYDIVTEKTAAFTEKGAVRCDTMEELISRSETVFFGVKPQNAAEILKKCDFSNVKYIISIMAGTKIDSILQKTNNPNLGVLRVMPNMPAKIGKGVSALCFRNIPEEKQHEFIALFERCGSTLVVEESAFDAVTSISGSGPAYVYMFLDALIQGGMDGGFDYENAKKLAIDTVIGAAMYAASESVPLNEMVNRVCSKGGTTIEAVNYYRENDLSGMIREGVTRCRDKSCLLSEQTK